MELPEQLEALSDAQRRDLFGWAALLKPLDRTPGSLAADMRSLHENMVSRRPGALAWLLLIGLYLAGFAVSAGTLVLAVQHKRAYRDREAAKLAAAFREAAADLREWRKQQAAAKDPAEKRRLQAQIDGRWEGLVAAWKAKPREVAVAAIGELLQQTRKDSTHAADLLRLTQVLPLQGEGWPGK
jgi:hypothetical protein